MLSVDEIMQIKSEIYEIDKLYANLKSQVLVSAQPRYIFSHNYETETPRFVRVEYDENTQQILNLLSKKHCAALEELAKRHGIKIENTSNNKGE